MNTWNKSDSADSRFLHFEPQFFNLILLRVTFSSPFCQRYSIRREALNYYSRVSLAADITDWIGISGLPDILIIIKY